jgi:hypothetical protein
MTSSQPPRPNRGGRGGGRGGRKSTSGTGSIRQKRTRSSVLNDDSGDTAVLDSQLAGWGSGSQTVILC